MHPAIVMSIPFEPEVIEQLRSAKRLQGKSATGGFAFDLDLSTPALAVAIHAGHNVREELLPLMQIPEKDRLFEEDPATDRMIRGNANAIWGLDSRAEYDLNRPARQAVPLTAEQFWGVQVYRAAPTDAMVRRSLEKYEAFYRFAGSCIRVLLERFGFCVVYDIHSYNISRQVEKGIAESSPVQSRNGPARSVALGQPHRCVAASAGQDRNPGDPHHRGGKQGFFGRRGALPSPDGLGSPYPGSPHGDRQGLHGRAQGHPA